MKNDSKGAGLGVLLVVGLIFIIGLIGSSEPECIMSGCDKDAKEGSSYCYMHDLSNRSYGNPDYNAVYENSQRNRSNSTSTTSSSTSNSTSTTGSSTSNSTLTTGSSTSNSTGSSSTNNKKTTSSPKKTYNTYNSYDEGYEDVYDNDDYDWDRYYEDDDYADGVDDAMDELGW